LVALPLARPAGEEGLAAALVAEWASDGAPAPAAAWTEALAGHAAAALANAVDHGRAGRRRRWQAAAFLAAALAVFAAGAGGVYLTGTGLANGAGLAENGDVALRIPPPVDAVAERALAEK